MSTGLAGVGVRSVDVYTIRAVAQDEFEDVVVPGGARDK